MRDDYGRCRIYQSLSDYCLDIEDCAVSTTFEQHFLLDDPVGSVQEQSSTFFVLESLVSRSEDFGNGFGSLICKIIGRCGENVGKILYKNGLQVSVGHLRVPGAGIEPARIAPLVFETSASTDSAIRAGVLFRLPVGVWLRIDVVRGLKA